MINSTTKMIQKVTIFFIIMLALTAAYYNPAYSNTIEETADMQFPTDRTVIGEMDDYSARSITVNNSRYDYCEKLVVFSPAEILIPVNDIDTAKLVKIFIKSNNCVRKIHVLRFDQ